METTNPETASGLPDQNRTETGAHSASLTDDPTQETNEGSTYRCEKCNTVVHIGDWYACPHGKPSRSSGFSAYFDIGLGREVTGWGDVRQAMREHHLDFRDHPNKERTEQYFERARLAREGNHAK